MEVGEDARVFGRGFPSHPDIGDDKIQFELHNNITNQSSPRLSSANPSVGICLLDVSTDPVDKSDREHP